MSYKPIEDELGGFSEEARQRALASLTRVLARSCRICGASMATATTKSGECGRLVYLKCPDCGSRRKVRD